MAAAVVTRIRCAVPQPLWSGAWSAGGRYVLTDADDGLVRRWPADEALVLELARQRDAGAGPRRS